MKKVLTIIMLSLLVWSLSFSAFANTTGGFIESPSANLAPELIEGGAEDHPCDNPLKITSYADRNGLSEEAKAAIEKAYSEIMSSKNLILICDSLRGLANKLGVSTNNLMVSELFDISDSHGHVEASFDIVIKPESLENFVGLLHYVDGKWELVEDAIVEEKDGEAHLKFSVDSLSPFAIVVDAGISAPAKDNSALIAVLAIIAIAEAAALVSIFVKFILGKKVA